MKSDFEIINKNVNEDITIYPITDVHLGSVEHNSKEWGKFIEKIKNEPNSYVVLGGDLINNATRSSVSNIFEELLRPREQKELMVKYLKEIKDKILCAVSGNHERRSIKDADDDPTYDIMCKLGLEDIYRENIAFLRIRIGSEEEISKRQHITYVIAITHGAGGGALTGSAVNKNERFAYTVDGLDALIVGHTHKGTVTKPSKLVIDSRNNKISFKPFTVVTSQSWLSYGGYATQKMLTPATNATADNGQKMLLKRKNKNITVIW